MAATFRWVNADSPHVLTMRVMEVTGDSSYPTGGYSMTPANVGLSRILYVDLASAGGYLLEYDYTNQKVKFYRETGAAGTMSEVPNTTNVSAAVGRLLVIGA